MKILIIVLLIIVLIGFIKLKINVSYCKEKGFKAVLKVVFFRFILYTKDRKKINKKVSAKKDKRKEKNEDKKKQSKKKKKKKKKDLSEIIELVKILLRPIPRFLKFLNRGFRIKDFKFKAIISKEEAKETALLYSNFCKVFYNVLGIIGNYCCIINKDVDISLDFINNKTKFNFDLNFNIRVGRIIVGVFIYLFFVLSGLISRRFFKNKRSGLNESSN